MGSEKLRNLRELLKISLYIHDPLELDLDYQRLNNINFDLTQNNQLHKIIELVETLISFVKAEKLLKDGEKCDRNTLAILKKKQYSARISRIISLDEGNNILDQALGKQLFSLIEFLLQSTTRENIEEQNKIGKIISSNLYNSLMDMTYILQEEAAQDNLENLDKSNAAILVKNFYMVRNFLDKYYDDKRKIGGTLKKDLYYQVQQILISFDVIDRVDNFDILCNFSQSVKATCDTGEDSLLVFFTDTKLSGLFKFIKQMLSVHKETALELLTTYIERLKKLADTSYQQEIFNKILNEQSVLFEEGETREIREQVIEHLDFLSVKSLIRASTSRQFASSRSSTSSKGSTGKRVNPKKEKRKIFR
jgi:hypothetical protein